MKKGDIVGRKSYGKDVFFSIERIIKMKNGKQIALLKGLTIRIEADSPIEDLEHISKDEVKKEENKYNTKIEKRIQDLSQYYLFKRKSAICTGKILHLDGDKRYSEKSNIYYKKMGLNAIVKNIQENKQPLLVSDLILRYNPDILVITGHDRNDKKGYRI